MKKFLSVVLIVVMIITALPLTNLNLMASAETEYTSGYYTYRLSNEKAEITDVDTSIKGNIIVPSTLDGYDVTSIGFNAFDSCESLTGVTIPEGVTIINTSAFSNCTSLANIVIPNSVTSIGDNAFKNTFYYNNINNWQNEALYIDKYLIMVKTTVSGLYEIKPDTVLIADFAFQNCKGLTGLAIGEKLRGIGGYAFYNCLNLKDVYITDVNAWCSIDFSMSASNPFYYAENLYLNDKPVTHLIIPEDVTFIKNYIFYKLNCITDVTLPKSVIGIGEYAFYNCKNIKNVYYPGDENGKTTISIGNYNECLTEAQWYYNCCIGSAEHKYDNDCDIDCNNEDCDFNRTVEGHKYANDCDANCDICEAPRTVGDHTYDNDCDANCNICEAPRTVEGHKYDNACDANCNICDEGREVPAHKYSNATCTAPKTCSVCNATEGKALGHKFANATCIKAKTCSVCGATEGKALGHKFANATCTKAKTCTVCKIAEGKALGHTYKNVVTKATLKVNGKVVKKCSVCGNVASTTTVYYPKTVKIAATSYTYNGRVITPAVTVKNSKGIALKNGTDYTATYAKGRKNVGTYKVTVTFKGNYSGTKTFNFTINPVKTTVNKLVAGNKSLKVTIGKKTNQVTGYEIRYATNKTFKSAKTKTVKSYKTTSVTLNKLTAKKTYYVRVRTYKTVGKTKYYSAWSTAKNKKTK